MSTNFKPGDVCVVIAAPCMRPEYLGLVGTECTVLREWHLSLLAILLGVKSEAAHYVVTLPNGDEAVFCSHTLRKKQPPQEEGSWDEVARITGWSPADVGAPA